MKDPAVCKQFHSILVIPGTQDLSKNEPSDSLLQYCYILARFGKCLKIISIHTNL